MAFVGLCGSSVGSADTCGATRSNLEIDCTTLCMTACWIWIGVTVSIAATLRTFRAAGYESENIWLQEKRQ